MKLNAGFIAKPEPMETDRLTLVRLDGSKRELAFRITSNEHIRAQIKMHVLDTEELFKPWWARFEEWKRDLKVVQWVVFEKGTDSFVGMITIKEINHSTLRGEIGYSFMPEHWGKGYALESLQVVLNYGFEKINFHTILAQILSDNGPSLKLIDRLGFTKEGHFKDCYFFEGEFYDLEQYVRINPGHI